MKTIGKNIKELRKERNLTQEELALVLNVTPQAVSKWENGTGLPDITQIVPLATFFNVCTDVLFGLCSRNNDIIIDKVIEESDKKITNRKKEDLFESYLVLQEGLNQFPSNLKLLQYSLEKSCALAYKENDCFDDVHAEMIYQTAIRQAKIIINYSKNITDILRANMIMVLLHSSFGNYNEAKKHANMFPWRSDMTVNLMHSYINNIKGDYFDEVKNLNSDFFYNLESMIANITRLGLAYERQNKYNEALRMFLSIFNIIESVFKEDKFLPALHIREEGDIHVFIARIYVKQNNPLEAISWLERMVDYDLNVRNKISNEKILNPFLRYVDYNFYLYHYSNNLIQELIEKLNYNEFVSL